MFLVVFGVLWSVDLLIPVVGGKGLIYWPFGRFGVPGYDKNAVPPGEVAC